VQEKAIEVFFYLPKNNSACKQKTITRGGYLSIFVTCPIHIQKFMQNMAIIMVLILNTCVDYAYNIPQHLFNALPM
jgi:hypothetical protein